MKYRALFRFGGHHAVTRSLVSGLKQCNFKINYNPNSIEKLAKNVVVLSGTDTLSQMIFFKKNGMLDQLLVGPNVVTLPEDENSILANRSIDKIIVPSEWIKEKYLRHPKLSRNKIYTWPAGVNIDFWIPAKKTKRNIVLIYIKNKSFNMSPLLSILHVLGLRFEVIFYGNYSESYYRKLLNKSLFMIYIASSESQGIALLESWSMDVPTFIFKDKFTIIKGIKFSKFSPAPYLTSATGQFWNSIGGLKRLISSFTHQKYQPRSYVLQYMTDKICASNFIKILEV
ncbi:GT4_PimA-like domain containing protein [Candidatus Methylopumilus universalis]|jgi:hypothetical protein